MVPSFNLDDVLTANPRKIIISLSQNTINEMGKENTINESLFTYDYL